MSQRIQTAKTVLAIPLIGAVVSFPGGTEAMEAMGALFLHLLEEGVGVSRALSVLVRFRLDSLGAPPKCPQAVIYYLRTATALSAQSAQRIAFPERPEGQHLRLGMGCSQGGNANQEGLASIVIQRQSEMVVR